MVLQPGDSENPLGLGEQRCVRHLAVDAHDTPFSTRGDDTSRPRYAIATGREAAAYRLDLTRMDTRLVGEPACRRVLGFDSEPVESLDALLRTSRTSQPSTRQKIRYTRPNTTAAEDA